MSINVNSKDSGKTMRTKNRLIAIALAALALSAPAAAQEVVLENYSVEEGGQRDNIPFLTPEAVKSFFGKRSVLVTYRATLAEQFENAINGRAYDMIDLGNGYSVYTACGEFNCQNKAIAIMNAKGALVGAGMIGYRCPGPSGECAETASAHGFIRKGMENTFVRKTLTDWSKKYLSDAPASKPGLTVWKI